MTKRHHAIAVVTAQERACAEFENPPGYLPSRADCRRVAVSVSVTRMSDVENEARRAKRRLGLWIALGAICLAVVLVLVSNLWVSRVARGHLFDEPGAAPEAAAALVLGCSKTIAGRPNRFFDERIAAAARLFRAGKVSAIVVSGDNSTRDYDEPSDMKSALAAAGIPAVRVHCDYAGFRTLDSVVRMREVFGQSRFIIVSQRCHNERAVFIARSKGLDAAAFNAPGVPLGAAPTTYLRESLARLKAVLDVEVLGTEPKFLGPPVRITP